MLKNSEYALRIPLRIFHLVPEEKRRLGLIVFFVGMIHLLLFMTLEIHYPTAHNNSVRRSEIFLSTSDLMSSTSWNSTLFWNQMRDPSLLLHQSLVEEERPKNLQPVFETISNSNLPLLPVGSDARAPLEEEIPLEKSALEKMIAIPNQFSYSSDLPPLTRKTQVLFSKNLLDRAAKKLPSLPTPSINLLNESRVSTLRIGISPEGFVLHSLIEESSGSSSVDQLALAEIRKIVFQPSAQQSLEWGSVTIYWTFSNPSKIAPEGP